MKKTLTLAALLTSLSNCYSNTVVNPNVTAKSDESRPIKTKINPSDLFLKKSDKSQTVHFGGSHQTARDNKVVESLLPELKKKGYDYFAVELETCIQPLIDEYTESKISLSELYQKFPFNETDDLSTIAVAHKLGYKIVLFDESPEWASPPGDTTHSSLGTDRAEKQFANLKEHIFDKDQDAKVVLLSGRSHLDEAPRYYQLTGFYDQKALGLFLEEYTKGKNLSVSLVEDEYSQYCDPRGYIKPDLSLSLR
ncbi:MAG: hypothetical protein KKA62_04270 [Nanoarchaeota archaeon]|nr:hypothetical protein [Nanoarchaeota archaeon]MBU1643969.1 hypothetical protein [Nanoarchaeota archaeon]MBU1977135.1 hypothetical protein [Nanoarchaeota archaeon]